MDRRFEIIRRIMQTPGTGFEAWGDTKDEGLWDTYQGTLVRLDTTTYLLKYLWPNFIEIDGMVFRERDEPRTIEQWREYCKKQGSPSPEQLEFLVNHLHLVEIFRNAPDRQAMDEAVWWYLAETIGDMWRCRLKQLFPGKRFDVQTYEGYGVEVSVVTDRRQ